MKFPRLFRLLPFAAPALLALISTAQAGVPAFDRADGGVVSYTTNSGTTASVTPDQTIQTSLSDIEYLGTLAGPNAPYFLLAAKPCSNCSLDRAIFALRAAPGAKPESFVYPGKIVDPKTGTVALDSRMFYGRCLARDSGNALVIFQREVYRSRKHRRIHRQSSVLVATPGEQHLETKLVEKRLPRLQDTLHYVRRGQCHEIDGRNRRMASKVMKLVPANSPDSPSSDDESTQE